MALCLLLTGPAYARTARSVQSLTRDEVQQLVVAMKPSADFPLVANDAVTRWLNKTLNSSGRRRTAREALARLDKLRPLLTTCLEKYSNPPELLAIPMVESSYNNTIPAQRPKASGKPRALAGLWQFTLQTAQSYGLKVTPTLDERLDVELATDAAMRYLRANQLRFDNWLLAVAAYNQGEGKVREAIAKAGTKDAWRLVELGHLNHYLVKITGSAIIIANPKLVE